MSDQGGCSCVQDTSVTLYEEYVMFWEVCGICSEIIGPLLNMSGMHHGIILSPVIYFLISTLSSVPLLVSLVFMSPAHDR